MLDLNDAEQLRYIAEQLEGASDGRQCESKTNEIDAKAGSSGVSGKQDAESDLGDCEDGTSPLGIVRIQSLGALDNLANQIIHFFSRQDYQTAMAVAAKASQESVPSAARTGRMSPTDAFSSLVTAFEAVKDIFLRNEHFILFRKMRYCFQNRENQQILLRANLATFICGVFGALPIGFSDLDKFFFETFVPPQGRLLKPQAALLLELRTQAYLLSLSQEGPEKSSSLLDVLFPHETEAILKNKHPESPNLAPGETDLVMRIKRRREVLATSTDSPESLARRYPWSAFLKEMCDYLTTNQHLIFDLDDVPYRRPVTQARSSPNTTMSSQNSSALCSPTSGANMHNGAMATKYPVTSGDTASMYESARQALNEQHHTGEVKSHFQRRQWTKEEEEALMKGLDQVRGPSWSQILELYGPGGKISDVLKDRNQVQLKDKARNLKLFFLKSGLPMPEVLQFVTGDVKSRAPKRFKMAQANSEAASTQLHHQHQHQHQHHQHHQHQQHHQIQHQHHQQHQPQHQRYSESPRAGYSVSPQTPSTMSPPARASSPTSSSKISNVDPGLDSGGVIKENDEDRDAQETASLEQLIQSVGEYISNNGGQSFKNSVFQSSTQ